MTAVAARPRRSAKLHTTVLTLICGCIDIGTNTTRLLVADVVGGRIGSLTSERVPAPVGAAVADDGSIPAAKIEEIAAAAGRLAATAGAANCERLVVLGTAAVRMAPNAKAVCEAVRESTGHELSVLTGEQEARLTFAGATHGLTFGEGPVAVIDVGGGSTELAIGTAGEEADWWCSLPIGSGIATAQCVRSDPPAPAEIDVLRERVRAALADLDPPPAEHALAVGGTAVSLVRLIGSTVGPEAFERTLDVLSAMPGDEAGEHFAIDPVRVRLLPAALLILGGVAERLGLELTIGGGGLREGAVLALAKGGL